MPHLWKPMAAQPPADFIAFVVGNLVELRRETAQMIGERHADRIYPDALSDLARQWHRLRRPARPGQPDAAQTYLRRRLAARVAQWREDNAYPVDVRSVSEPDDRSWSWDHPPRPFGSPPSVGPPPPDSVARRMAALLPPTQRTGLGEVAEAEIAWVHAYERYRLLRVTRHLASVVLALGAIVQVMSRLSDAGQ